MSSNGKATIDRIDHGVLPSNDLGRAHRFYSTFMGGELDHLTNLTIRGLNREVPQILFYTLANHKGWGLALQDFPIASTPVRPMDGVVYGFEVAADNLADVVRAAEEGTAREKRKRDRLRSGELGLEIDGLRAKLKELGVEYVERAPDRVAPVPSAKS